MARTRYRADVDRIKLSDLPAAALRAVLREGYTRADLRADVLAGLVVGIVALPLAMALAIAVGVAPQHGLYTVDRRRRGGGGAGRLADAGHRADRGVHRHPGADLRPLRHGRAAALRAAWAASC